MNAATIVSCKSAGEQFFRLYHKHCVEPDVDTLFNLLNSIHSFNDKLRKATGESFFELNEFIALKALRNLAHHEVELINKVRIFPVTKFPQINTELLFLCLIPSHLVFLSFEQLDKKRRESEEAIIRRTLKWYGNVVNINPCLFNFAIHAFERLKTLDIKLEGDEYTEFENSYQLEEDAGYSHFITGDIGCIAGNVEDILATTFADVT